MYLYLHFKKIHRTYPFFPQDILLRFLVACLNLQCLSLEFHPRLLHCFSRIWWRVFMCDFPNGPSLCDYPYHSSCSVHYTSSPPSSHHRHCVGAQYEYFCLPHNYFPIMETCFLWAYPNRNVNISYHQSPLLVSIRAVSCTLSPFFCRRFLLSLIYHCLGISSNSYSVAAVGVSSRDSITNLVTEQESCYGIPWNLVPPVLIKFHVIFHVVIQWL